MKDDANQLLVFPGGSSPCHQRYKDTFELLVEYGKRRDWTVTVLRYPGQEDERGTTNGYLSPASSIEYALGVLDDFKNVRYRTLGVSYGCSISLACAVSGGEGIEGWERAIVWGPVPTWMIWEAFVKKTEVEGLARGSRVLSPRERFYYEAYPVEWLVRSAPLPVTVGVGSLDRYVTEPYLRYLEAICGGGTRGRRFLFIEGCNHNVRREDPGLKEYLTAIFD